MIVNKKIDGKVNKMTILSHFYVRQLKKNKRTLLNFTVNNINFPASSNNLI